MEPIEVDGLTKVFGETRAIDDLHFEVHEGEIFGYLGPNGAGKSTTLRTLMGFIEPTAGTATVLGRDIRDEAALIEARRDVGYLPGDLNFDGSVTGRDFLEYQGRLKGDDRLEELMDLFSPPFDRRIREYSTGNKQMLGIIQAFMHDPDLLIMDEPTSGLDPLVQERLNTFLRDERSKGKTIVFSSHVLGEVRRVCDRVGIIRDGHIVALEDIGALMRKGGKRVRIHTAEPMARADIDQEGVFDFETVGSAVRGEMVHDLPGGARRLVVKAHGVHYTIVNGKVVYDHGEPTGQLPGQVLRSGSC